MTKQIQPRFRAEYNGVTLGWFDTLDQAQDAIVAAKKHDADNGIEPWMLNPCDPAA